MSRDEDLARIAADVDRLVNGWNRKMISDRGEVREMSYPGLIEQMRDEMISRTESGDGNRPGKAIDPKLPTSETIFSLLVEVEALIGAEVIWTGATRRSGDVLANLLWLARVAPSYDDAAVASLADTVAGARHRVEVALGWTEVAKAVRGTCPACAGIDGITLDIGDYAPVMARCKHCAATWDASQLGVLASALRAS